MIKFTKNHNNKLNCGIFTTIRISDPGKEIYYRSKVGSTVTVGSDNIEIEPFEAELVGFYVETYSNLPDALVMVDTGEPTREGADKKYKRFGINRYDKVVVLVLKSFKYKWEDEKDNENQLNLF